ncbi:MAG TPA: hypothetical protein PLV45_05395, partial [bacterium]|nr:hypothetical protein [bacterium]
VSVGVTAEEQVRITAPDDVPVKVLSAAGNSEHLGVELAGITGSTDGEPENSGSEPAGGASSWILTLTLRDTAPAGRFSDTVVLTTDAEQQPEIPIDVLGFIRSNVTVRPTQCYLGTLVPGESVTKTFTVRKTGPEPNLKPPEIKTPPEFMTFTVTPVVDQKEYAIEATFTVPPEHSGRLSGAFTVVTGQESLPEFEVPVFGYVLPPDTATSSEGE